jgi:hypothetical protein
MTHNVKTREKTKQAKITKQPKERREIIFVCFVVFACFVFSAYARADELHLKDGRVIDAEEMWQVGDAVWYRQGKIIASVPKADVVKITKPQPATESAAKTEKKIENKEAGDGKAATRKIVRIALKDGTQIDADSVWESADRIGYSLGKMQSFIDRVEVKEIFRNFSVTETGATPDIKFRFSTGHRGLDQLIVYSAAKYQIDPLLIYLVMREESGFNHRAVSRAGARGLMQLMPATARRLGVRNIHDPFENVEAGTRYLRSLLEMFDGDVNLALAAYNAGEDTVVKYGRRIPPYRETMNYVWRINTAYRRAAGNR